MRAISRSRFALQIPEHKGLLLLGDLIVLEGAALFALWLWTLPGSLAVSGDFLEGKIPWLAGVTLFWVAAAPANDLYNLRVLASRRYTFNALLRVGLLGVALYLTLYLIAPLLALPLRTFLSFMGLAVVLIGVWRSGYISVIGHPFFRLRILVVGAGLAGRAIVQAIRDNAAFHVQVLGFIDDDLGGDVQQVEEIPVLGTYDKLVPLVREQLISGIIVAISHDMQKELLQALLVCAEMGVQITSMPIFFEEITGQIPINYITNSWYLLLPLEHPALRGVYPFLKRCFDVGVALVGLTLFGALFPFLAVAIYLESRGPIFYLQQRVGQGGKIFWMAKLRTMVPDAEKEGKAVWADKADPRVTGFGRLLRQTMLDELPQLWNVLKGEMSFVGPRPERPDLVAELERQVPFYGLRHAVKPGMAGWALIHTGYSRSLEDALIKQQYDLYYIKHQSLFLDILIILKTIAIPLSFRRREAC